MELLKQQAEHFIRSAINGDIGSFEQLVVIYQDRVFSLALKLTGSALDAEDLAQEVFIKAFRSIRSFRGDSDFGTWLHRIAINTWLNQKRKNMPRQAYSLDEPIFSEEGMLKSEIADISNEPESVLLKSQISVRLHKSMECLSKDQKAVLLLREVEECTYEEIALILNCSLGTVRSRLARAREALRNAYNRLDDTGYENKTQERVAEDDFHKGKKTQVGQS